METKQLHRVDKIHVRVQTHSVEDGYYLKDNIGEWIRKNILPYLETYFAGLETELGRQIIQFDKLKVSLDMKDGKLETDHIFQDVLDQIGIQVKPLLEQIKNPDKSSETKPEGNIIDPAGREIETLFYFLKTGRCPWWIPASGLNELLNENNLAKLIRRENEQFCKKIIELLPVPGFKLRLIRQFSNKLLYKILNNTFCTVSGISLPGNYPKELYFFLNRLSNSQKEQFWSSVIQMLLVYKNEQSVPVKLWAEIFRPVLTLLLSAKRRPSVQDKSDILMWLEELTQLPVPETARKELFLDVIARHYLKTSKVLSEQEQETLDALEKKLADQKVPAEQEKPVNEQLKEDQKAVDVKKPIDEAGPINEMEQVDPKAKKLPDNKETARTPEEQLRSNKTGNEQERLIETEKLVDQKKPADQQQPLKEVPVEEKKNADQEKPLTDQEFITPEKKLQKDPAAGDQKTEQTAGPETEKGQSENQETENHDNGEWKMQPEDEMELKKNGIIVENAGLILVHPFLKSFLMKIELLNEKNEITDPELAVHVLHYVATGRQQDWDHNLLFEKFLCNVPLSQSLTRKRVISAEIREEVDSMLHALLENWAALKNSSKELLRNEFLQRPGKLFIDDFSVRLTVERKTYDILLDKLPWNISMVKLPWHRHLIYTTW